MDKILIQKFNFEKPLEFEYVDYGGEIVALPEKIIIRANNLLLSRGLPEMLSKAKLGEKDYLLVSFFFQKNMKELEKKYAHMFVELCQPLQDAWTYKIMRKYAPDIYEEEIQKLIQVYALNVAYSQLLSINKNDSRLDLSMYAILAENHMNNFDFSLQMDMDSQVLLKNYISELTTLVHEEPSPELYLRLPLAAQSPYHVSIQLGEDGFRHYEVQGIANVCATC